jgi:hypothetical protein
MMRIGQTFTKEDVVTSHQTLLHAMSGRMTHKAMTRTKGQVSVVV